MPFGRAEQLLEGLSKTVVWEGGAAPEKTTGDAKICQEA